MWFATVLCNLQIGPSFEADFPDSKNILSNVRIILRSLYCNGWCKTLFVDIDFFPRKRCLVKRSSKWDFNVDLKDAANEL